MRGKHIWPVYWALVVVFILVISLFFVPVARELLLGATFLIGSGIALFLLGAVLIYLTVKERVKGLLKRFLLVTGASAVGIPISAVLHNVLYGLIYVSMLNRPDLDEPFFFILAVFVCPAGFLVGAVGSIVLFVRRRQVK